MLDDGRTLDDSLERAPAFGALTGRDRAFARAIASTTLRRLGAVDAVLAQLMQRPVPDPAKAARAILRVGAAQLLAMGGAPHAVVSEAVADAKAHAPAFAGLINAVLRRVAAEGLERLARLAPGVDLPDWLYARWRAAYGEAKAEAIAAALQSEAPIDLTAKTDARDWADRLGGVALNEASVRLPRDHAPLPDLPGYDEGAWWAQDVAAAVPARLFGALEGARALDLCAAPGGKTLQLAAAGAQVTALDVSDTRLERLRRNLERCRLSAEIVAADARTHVFPDPFDAVLLDAPCTATGTLRRRPDAAWLRRPTDIPALAALQTELLAAAARHVREGGRVVYAVCSLEPEEGEAIAAGADQFGLALDPIAPSEVAGLEAALTPSGALRILPTAYREHGGADGFFVARFRRVSG